MRIKSLLLGVLLIAISIGAIGEELSEPGAAVAPFDRELFVIHGSIGSITPEQRAAEIEKNIRKIAKDVLYKPDMLEIVKTEDSVNLVFHGHPVLGVTPHQAKIEGAAQEELAERYRDAIIIALDEQRESNLWYNIILQTVLMLGILTVGFFLIRIINRIYRYLSVRRQNIPHKVGATGEILEAILPSKGISRIINLIRFLALGVVAILCFFGFLWAFPPTKRLAYRIIELVTDPLGRVLHGIWNYIPDLFAIIVIGAVAYFFTRLIKVFALKIVNKKIIITGFHEDWALPTYHIICVFTAVFTLIFIFPHLPNSESSVFKGISVFLGVLISLGSTSFIGNIVSGLVITYMRPFNVGDRIKMGDHIGKVIEKNSLVTRILTLKNEIVTIPNSVIMTANTINYTVSAKEYSLIVSVPVTVGYDVPWQKVHQLLKEAASSVEAVMKNPEPFIIQSVLSEFCIQYQLNVYTEKDDQIFFIQSDLLRNIQDIFAREKIDLVTPAVIKIEQ